MRRALAALLCLAAGPANAFSISSGFTNPCHEPITGRAYEAFFIDLPTRDLKVPDGEEWQRLAGFMLDAFGIDEDEVDFAQRFLLVSLVVGVRSPDTEGHSALNLDALRELHADPAAEGQYAHCLRGPDDDLSGGNSIAIEGTRQVIGDLIEQAATSLEAPQEDQIIEADFYLDFYGDIDVQVWAPMYYLGRAAHAMQDCFAHTIRDDAADLRKVVYVLNYVDAIATGHDEDVDGLAHSDSMDDCTRGDTEDTVAAATEATVDLFIAARDRLFGRDDEAIEHVLDKWITVKEGCDATNDYCDNARWLKVVREHQTGPYVEELLGCRTAPGRGGLSGLALVVLGVGRRRREKA